MKAILAGPPQAGKTTLFEGLCAHTGGRFATASTHHILNITLSSDERLARLKEITARPNAVPARFSLADPTPAASEGQKTALMRQCDVLVFVLPLFAGADPQKQRDEFINWRIQQDLEIVEGRLERVEAAMRKGGAAKKEAEKEHPVLVEVAQRLRNKQQLADIISNPEKRRLLAHFGLLCAKPIVWVANTSEDEPSSGPQWAFSICAKLEKELAEMEEAERAEFLAMFGLERLHWDELIKHIYFGGGWGLFYTIGEEEVRAWEMSCGMTAREAAAKIHSDFAKHFVKAEIVRYEDVVECGGWDAAVAAGKMRSVAADHPLRDGDVVYIKAAVR